MAQTKTQQDQMRLLDELRPKRKEGKESKYYPNPSLFTKEKTFIVRGAEHRAPADWRKFIIQGREIILFAGEPILQADYELIEKQGKDALAFYISDEKVSKKKPAITGE
jgi:hypothetical protein